MIYINPNDDKIKEASIKHYHFIRYVIKKKLNGDIFDEIKPHEDIPRIYKVKVSGKILNFLNDEDNLRKILIGMPDELNEIKDFFSGDENKSLKLLFNYDNWVKKEAFYEFYHPYDLAKSLNINTCIYCNRLYTKTVIKEDTTTITRPEFDHWFPRSEFPLLSLSFYNLIPSCHVCNSSVKRANLMTLENHFHPYLDKNSVINEEIKFSYYNKSLNEYGFKLITKENSKGRNTVEAFRLQEIYQTHEDEIVDLRKIRDTYSESYLQKLTTQFTGLAISEEEIYRLAFGVYKDESMFDKRPLSKMKRDILIELGIIKKDG
ncbi:hypothetical protein RT99_02210 [Flavobacterium sp. MEB061]|uniref:hypothetical protein n=1 Tax=Flavobacterium sp. MEB061 TaxID=1587524 RepID=UPI0005AD098D|nr:hypothetical protein [Flavobacterium sp. MEB061]KIQ24915.1 hypothetical protein RT99_02210 [Flavobacterium sp. MEB061]